MVVMWVVTLRSAHFSTLAIKQNAGLDFLGFFGFFYIFAQKREFLGFFQFQEYF
jgi:hypothetical protein